MSRSTRIYVAGPMRGYPELNFAAFMDAADRFRRAGYTVFNPVEIGRAEFGLSPDAVAPHEFLRADVRVLVDCDAIAVLPGWEFSTGARCEAAVAVGLGLTFYDAQTGDEITTPALIEIRGGYDKPVALPPSQIVA